MLDQFGAMKQRLCTTVSWQTAQLLQERADYEGRSLSNLMAFLLEAACQEAKSTYTES